MESNLDNCRRVTLNSVAFRQPLYLFLLAAKNVLIFSTLYILATWLSARLQFVVSTDMWRVMDRTTDCIELFLSLSLSLALKKVILFAAIRLLHIIKAIPSSIITYRFLGPNL